ncbi:MAG: hypothetical protein CR982_04185 [Candidatus Cloacimonadota bacterium]|nr:MAG: hypothetical protein CR982_04185 [Candidatus Cloacimonadota bacterium]PIE78478.1 MAG: hypothetical protein CSA15_07225 [Candidatus Delongbacteria bacterium]
MINYKEIIDREGLIKVLPLNIVYIMDIKRSSSSKYELIRGILKIVPNVPEIIGRFKSLLHFEYDIFSSDIYDTFCSIGINRVINCIIVDEIVKNLENKYLISSWSSSLLGAFYSLELSNEMKSIFKDELFLSCFFINIGKVFVKKYFPIEYESIYSLKRSDSDIMKLEDQVLGVSSNQVSSYILKYCGFDKSIWSPVELLKANIDSLEDEVLKESLFILKKSMDMEKISSMLGKGVVKYKDDLCKGMEKINLDKILESVPLRYNEFIEDSGYPLEKSKRYIDILESENRILVNLNSRYETILKELHGERDKNKILAEKIESINHKLLKIALKDPLTGAYNRRYLKEFLAVEFSRVKRTNTYLLIIASDIDFFKKINDTYGHSNGDIVLKEVVKTFKGCIRATDIVSRTGGEEFIVVCQSGKKESGVLIAEKIRRSIEKTQIKLLSGETIGITMSFGVSIFPNENNLTIESVLDFADKKLYEAKERGRNRVCF